LRNRTNAVGSGTASLDEKPQNRRKLARPSSFSASGGQASSPSAAWIPSRSRATGVDRLPERVEPTVAPPLSLHEPERFPTDPTTRHPGIHPPLRAVNQFTKGA
jgi:hypothetical protein